MSLVDLTGPQMQCLDPQRSYPSRHVVCCTISACGVLRARGFLCPASAPLGNSAPCLPSHSLSSIADQPSIHRSTHSSTSPSTVGIRLALLTSLAADAAPRSLAHLPLETGRVLRQEHTWCPERSCLAVLHLRPSATVRCCLTSHPPEHSRSYPLSEGLMVTPKHATDHVTRTNTSSLYTMLETWQTADAVSWP